MPRKKKNKNKNIKNDIEPEALRNAPHSFVFHRGTVPDTVQSLAYDFRKVMEPYTASSLKARKANSVKDFVSVAGVLHVSHMAVFSSSETGTYMKVARIPRGPTLYFKVVNYSLARDVISSLKRQLVFQKQFEHPPLVILNNFGGELLQLKLMASMFQNMFPAINLTKINLNNVRRCVLFNYNAVNDEVDVRHYAIKLVPVGMSRGVKKVVQSRVPNLGRFNDISELITKAQVLSESEAEDDPNSHVTLPQKMTSRGNTASSQSSIRLIEQGPRITLQLLKIEEGLMSGQVLYHRHIVKTEEEKKLIVTKRLEKQQLKEERKRIQAECVRRKEQQKEEHKRKSLKGMKSKGTDPDDVEEEEDDDAAWYKQEVGKEPEHDLFRKRPKTKPSSRDGEVAETSKTSRKRPFANPHSKESNKKMKLQTKGGKDATRKKKNKR